MYETRRISNKKILQKKKEIILTSMNCDENVINAIIVISR